MVTTANESIEGLQRMWHRAPRKHKYLLLYITRHASRKQLLRWWDDKGAYHAIHVLLQIHAVEAYIAALVHRCPEVLLLRDTHERTALHYKQMYGHRDDALWCFCVAALLQEPRLTHSLSLHDLSMSCCRLTNSPMNPMQRSMLQQLMRCERSGPDAVAPNRYRLALTPLHLAAWRGDVQGIRSGHDPTAYFETGWGQYGYSPLWFAVVGGHADVVTAMLEGASSAIDLDVLFPLACSLGHHDVIATLLRSGMTSSSTLSVERHCLHWCILHGKVATVDLLLAHGAQVTSSDDVTTPLKYAVGMGHRVLTHRLLREGALPEKIWLKEEIIFMDGPLKASLQPDTVHHCGNFHDIRQHYDEASLFVQPDYSHFTSLLDLAAASNCKHCLLWCLRAAPTLQPAARRGFVIPTIYRHALAHADVKQLQILTEALKPFNACEPSGSVASYTFAYTAIRENVFYRESLLLHLLRTRPNEFTRNTLSEFFEDLLTDERGAPVPWTFLDTLLRHECLEEWRRDSKSRYFSSRTLNMLLIEFATHRSLHKSPDAIVVDTDKTQCMPFQVILLYYRRVVAAQGLRVQWEGLHRLNVISAFTPKELQELAWVLFHACGVRDENVMWHVAAYRRKLRMLEAMKTGKLPSPQQSQGSRRDCYLRGLSTIPWLTWRQDMQPMLGIEPQKDFRLRDLLK